jgi:4-amino-4-deoxy-L-arabinose transferase-like glycosyltransferase
VTVKPHANRSSAHLGGCVGFWLWALLGAGLVLGFITLGVFVLVPAIVLAVVLGRRWRGGDGRAMVGLVAGAGLALLLVAALQWNAWHDRTVGDNTPNPFYWGGVGICLLATGIVAYAVRSRSSS